VAASEVVCCALFAFS